MQYQPDKGSASPGRHVVKINMESKSFHTIKWILRAIEIDLCSWWQLLCSLKTPAFKVYFLLLFLWKYWSLSQIAIAPLCPYYNLIGLIVWFLKHSNNCQWNFIQKEGKSATFTWLTSIDIAGLERTWRKNKI